MPCDFNVVKVYKKFIINKWYYVISCGIINLMSTKYILRAGGNSEATAQSGGKEKWRLKNGS